MTRFACRVAGSALAATMMLTAGCSAVHKASEASGGESSSKATAVERLSADAGPVTTFGPTGAALLLTDLRVGKGEPVAEGASVTVQVVGTSATGTQLQSTWETGQPITFTIGRGDVIEGWERAVIGMRLGGQRRASIPAELVRGGRGANVPQLTGQTLVYVFELQSVNM